MRKSLILASGVAIISALTPTLLSAKQLNVDDYKKAEQQLSSYTSKLVTGTVDYPLWSSNDTLVYRSHTEDGDKFFKVDINSQKKSLAFDHKKLAESLARITDSEVNHDKFPFTQVEFISANNIKFSVKAKSYQCDLTHYLCQLDELSQKSAENLSPDGKRAVFIRDHNLWLRDLITDKESQLTTDGIKDFGYATNNAGWVRRDSPVVTWAPDSKKLTTFKHDGRNVGDMGIVSTAVGHPTIDVWKYPLPGDEHIFAIHRVVIDVESKKVTPLDMAPDAHRSTITDHVAGRNGELLDIDWADDSKTFAFVSSTRDHKTATLKIADAKTGKVKLVMSETQKSFFESGVDGISWQYLEKSNEAIWFSQRSNWGHLYLIDLATGKVKQQITQGDWTVIELLHVDQQTGKLIFTGAGKEGSDPYYHYLYSVNKDGSELTLLTPEKKHHRITLNKAGTHFLDRAATPTTAEISRVRAVSNNKELTIETMDISQLKGT